MFRIHLPYPRVAMILNLIVWPTMPLAIALTTPKHIVGLRIGGLDLARLIGATLGSYATIFESNVLGSGSGIPDHNGSFVMMSMCMARSVPVRVSMSGALCGGRARGRVCACGCGRCCCDVSAMDIGARDDCVAGGGRWALCCARARRGDEGSGTGSHGVGDTAIGNGRLGKRIKLAYHP
jgi:hypothetical protein